MGQAMQRNSQEITAAELIDTIVAECRDPARLLELYYWSKEPQLLPIIRAIAALAPPERARFGQLLRNAEPPFEVTQLVGDVPPMPRNGRAGRFARIA